MDFLLGLVGFPLVHSLSPKLHEAALSATGLEGNYCLYPVPPGDPQALADLIGCLRTRELQGLNVTIPYKQVVIPYLDELTLSARAIGAVNTMYLENGRLIGHNTDAPGFQADLAKFLGGKFSGKEALVLGAGGAARAVVYSLLADGWIVNLAVRPADIGQAGELISAFTRQPGYGFIRSTLLEAGELSQLKGGLELIVNTTPVGMYPETECSPWPADLPFPQAAVVYDLVYNPRQTRLVSEARQAGLRATSGLGMLVEQAALSFTCWTGLDVPREVMVKAAEA
jgi:shikimate dehydrogenase